MQINQENIQRPALFSDFFGLELMWNNEYLKYIITTVNKVVTSTANNIKKLLNTKKFINPISVKTSFKEVQQSRLFREIFYMKFKNCSYRQYLLNTRNHIMSTQA